MTKVSIIGLGKWGKTIKNSLKTLDVEIVQPEESDWVIVSTPNDLHYEYCLTWLNKGKNVFCEKPCTLSYESTKKLYNLSKSMNLNFYVDDVFCWRDDIKINEKYNSFQWNKLNTTSHLERFAYHHFYLWSTKQKELIIKDISGDNKTFRIELENGNSADFTYKEDLPQHKINNLVVSKTKNNPLEIMFNSIFNDTVDYELNENNTLNATLLLEATRKNCYKKALVIGGGIFGTTSAIMLSNNGYNVDLFEKSQDIMQCASSINQYRLHCGYHYPRSIDTAKSCLSGLELFRKKYFDCLVSDGIKNIYAISSEHSLTSAEDYEKFLQEVKLPYSRIENILNCDLTISANELLFDHKKLIEQVKNKIFSSSVNVSTGIEVKDIQKFKQEYDVIVIATYANLNQSLKNKKEYQYEVCEKPVVKLPKKFKGKSVVIMDGPFMCIDPMGEYFVLGNVVHAIHQTNVGTKPIINKNLEPYLNNGVIKNPKFTNIDKFIETGKKYFGEEFGDLQHIGSMYTVRTVLKNREHDDARPTLVRHEEDNVWSLFGGKIDTCVIASVELLDKLRYN